MSFWGSRSGSVTAPRGTPGYRGWAVLGFPEWLGGGHGRWRGGAGGSTKARRRCSVAYILTYGFTYPRGSSRYAWRCVLLCLRGRCSVGSEHGWAACPTGGGSHGAHPLLGVREGRGPAAALLHAGGGTSPLGALPDPDSSGGCNDLRICSTASYPCSGSLTHATFLLACLLACLPACLPA